MGTASGNAYSPWKAFTEAGNGWNPSGGPSGKYVQITLPTAEVAKQLLGEFVNTPSGSSVTFSLQATNDSTWAQANIRTLISNKTITSGTFSPIFNFSSNDIAYRYYRIVCSSQSGSVTSGYGLKFKLQGIE